MPEREPVQCWRVTLRDNPAASPFILCAERADRSYWGRQIPGFISSHLDATCSFDDTFPALRCSWDQAQARLLSSPYLAQQHRIGKTRSGREQAAATLRVPTAVARGEV